MNPRCPHCGGRTRPRLAINTLDHHYKCTTTGCRCLVVAGRNGIKVEGGCLILYRTGREVHSVPVAKAIK